MATRPEEPETLLDVNQAARRARRSPETIRRWVWSGRLAARRDGRRWLIAEGDLDQLAAPAGGLPPSSLAQWASMARDALTESDSPTHGSAADLVLGDRRQRAEGAHAS